MLKGFALFYILSLLFRNPLLALITLFIIYAVADKAYFGFLPDFSAPFKRSSRIKSLRAELAVNPANAAGAQELGVLYFEKKDYRKALEFLNKAAEKIDNSARLYLYLGMTYMELNRPEDAKAPLEKALELDRKVGYGLPYIYLLRYELTHKKSNPEEIEKLEEGLTNFSSTENFYRMGQIYKKLGRREKAREMFQHALKEYAYVPKGMRRIHRRWAMLARIQMI